MHLHSSYIALGEAIMHCSRTAADATQILVEARFAAPEWPGPERHLESYLPGVG